MDDHVHRREHFRNPLAFHQTGEDEVLEDAGFGGTLTQVVVQDAIADEKESYVRVAAHDLWCGVHQFIVALERKEARDLSYHRRILVDAELAADLRGARRPLHEPGQLQTALDS